MRHTLTEALSGLRRNITMTIAVVVTMWVSLSLFGVGLLSAQQVDLIKGRWYDKIEVTVFPVSYTHLDVYKRQESDSATLAEASGEYKVLRDDLEVLEIRTLLNGCLLYTSRCV